MGIVGTEKDKKPPVREVHCISHPYATGCELYRAQTIQTVKDPEKKSALPSIHRAFAQCLHFLKLYKSMRLSIFPYRCLKQHLG